MAAPAPMGWIAEPKAAEVPTIPPGGFIEMGIKIHPTGTISENLVLAKKVSIVTGYLADMGDLTVSTRVRIELSSHWKALSSMLGYLVDSLLDVCLSSRILLRARLFILILKSTHVEAFFSTSGSLF